MKFSHIVPALLAASLVACGGEPPAPAAGATPPESATPAPQPLTVTGAIKAFQAAGLPIDELTEYTAETDDNQLLGRPGQYTGKVNWADGRHADAGASNTVEAFANDADLQTRKAYIEQVTAGSPMLLQYITAHRNLLLRLDKSVTPAEAAEYEKALKSL